MNRGARVTGVVVGTAGLILTVLLVVVVWVVDGWIVGAIDRAFTAVDDVLDEVEASVGDGVARLEDLRGAAAQGSDEVLTAAARELAVELERLRSFGAALQPAAEIADHLLPVEIEDEVIEAASSVMGRIETASAAVDAAIDGEVTELEAALAPVGEQLDESLAALDGRLVEVRSELDNAQSDARLIVHLIALALTFLVAWFGAGQAALVAVSRGRRSGTTVDEGTSEEG